jgi:hypothetical protein
MAFSLWSFFVQVVHGTKQSFRFLCVATGGLAKSSGDIVAWVRRYVAWHSQAHVSLRRYITGCLAKTAINVVVSA